MKSLIHHLGHPAAAKRPDAVVSPAPGLTEVSPAPGLTEAAHDLIGAANPLLLVPARLRDTQTHKKTGEVQL